MCGITGWFNNIAIKHKDLLVDMCNDLAHRGPNCSHQKIFGKKENISNNNYEGTIGLGHTRLSIIDLTADANQPMSDCSSRYWIVFNGEIYNYHELRKELLANHDIRFKSNSDTEVLLYSYIYNKEYCLPKLNGIFAFAIYDAHARELFLARDRLGIKPLYYYDGGHEFAFGSELKPIYRYLGGRFEINNDALLEFFIQGYIGSPHTIARNCFKLPPATWLKVNLKTGNSYKQYWTINEGPVRNSEKWDGAINENRIIDITKESIKKAVRYQLVSDVPLCTFLSGGIDSSLVTALASKETAGRLDTFSIGFKEQNFDESQYARRIAEYLGTNHHEMILTEKDFLNLAQELPQTFDEPFADSSAISSLALSRFVREGITVALSGDGGDEQFYGYTRYDHMKNIARLQLVPLWIRRMASHIVTPEIFGMDLSHKIRVFAYNNVFAANQNLSNVLPLFKNTVYNGKALDSYFSDEYTSLAFENYLMLKDLNGYMIDDVLVKVDRASMRHGLEVRVPLLDHEVVENSFYTIPLHLKTRLPKKSVLKTILSEYIPQDLFERPKKGFGIPLQKWVNNDLNDTIKRTISEKSTLDHILNKKALLTKFNNKKIINTKFGAELFWRVYVFMCWEKQYYKTG